MNECVLLAQDQFCTLKIFLILFCFYTCFFIATKTWAGGGGCVYLYYLPV